MQRVDTAAIEAFRTFQEINRFINELMELCVRNNQHELISQMNASIMIKANEIAGAIGVNAELFLQRIPTLKELVSKGSQQPENRNYIIVPQNGQEDPEQKPLQEEPRSQFTLPDALGEESEVVVINSTP
ncbi:hypothetical protein TELCIR_25963 [Teladorsagia circumcincta]|uniref:Uncharacterized protein n=1 Tax=Teladorsagia circumcincta TaxID=45464 RepID=A0A2G9T442_TELCI|nr:hypothetical protein TELCIR_25963 [Teladorsagia circumcincta]